MPNFQVSLRDTHNKIAIYFANQVIYVNDFSDYIDSDESGHLHVNFQEYGKIVITKPNLEIDTLSFIPAIYNTQPIQTIYADFTEDGLYKFNLIAVPTWFSTKNYVYDSTMVDTTCVYYNGVLYMCLVSHTSGTFATDLAAGKWVAITDTDLTPKYSTSEFFVLNNDIVEKSRVMTIEMALQIANAELNTNLWTTEMDLVKTVGIYVTSNAMDDINVTEQFSKAETITNYGKFIIGLE